MIITTRKMIKGVARSWKNIYYGKDGWSQTTKLNSRDVYRQLSSLDTKTCSEEDVANIIGNYTWTRITCSDCYKRVDRAMVVQGDGGEVVHVCLKCCKDVVKEMEEYNE